MKRAKDLFTIDCLNETIVITATSDLSEFEYEALEEEADEALAFLVKGDHKNVVVDLSRSDYCGSTALGLFLKLWKQARRNGGRMALYGLSENEREVFATMKLDTLWPICATRDEALVAVEGPSKEEE